MTEKRFKLKYINEQHISANLYDNETFIGSIGIGEELIVELLNDLSAENEQLKSKNRGLQSELGIFKEDVTHSNQIINKLNDENEQLKQFPVKLDNRISKLEESLKALKEMETDDLNPQAVEDVATVIGMSLNALLEFRKELNGDVE